MAGRAQALQPDRPYIGLGAEIERQRRQIGSVERLKLCPHRQTRRRVELNLYSIDQFVHTVAAIAGKVLSRPAVALLRNLVGAQGRQRHRLRRTQPSIHGKTRIGALGHGLAEEHPRRLVANHRLNADLTPLALQHLLHQLARLVAGRGHEGKGELLTRRIAPHAVAARGPTGFIEKRRSPLRIVSMVGHRLAINAIEWIDVRMGHRLMSAEQLLAE